MELIVLIIIISPIMISALKEKQKILCLFFAFYPFFPDSFAIEFASGIPLLTASRIILIILIVCWWKKTDGKLKFDSKKMIFVYLYITLFISIINLRFGTADISRLIIVIMEEFFLIIIIKDYVRDRDVFYKCIEYILKGALGLCVIGMMQTLLDFNPAIVLQIITDRYDNELTNRMGMVRAYGTSNAISFGAYLVLSSLLAIYMYERTKKCIYMCVFAIVMITIAMTLSRSAFLSLAVIYFIMLFMRKGAIIKKYYKHILAVIGILVIGIFLSNKIFAAFYESVKSMLYLFGVSVVLSDDFGANGYNISASRTVQWSAVLYMIKDSEGLFGYGYNAFTRGMLKFFWPQYNSWQVADTLDVGWVKVATEVGIVGLMNYLVFVFSQIRCYVKNMHKSKMTFYNCSFYIMIGYFFINIFSAFVDNHFVWLLFSLMFAYHNNKLCYQTHENKK